VEAHAQNSQICALGLRLTIGLPAARIRRSIGFQVRGWITLRDRPMSSTDAQVAALRGGELVAVGSGQGLTRMEIFAPLVANGGAARGCVDAVWAAGLRRRSTLTLTAVSLGTKWLGATPDASD